MKWTLHNPIAFTPLPVTIITSTVYLGLLIAILVIHLVVPSAPHDAVPVRGINVSEAWGDLQFLTNGFHPYNSHRNDIVRDWLLRRIDTILKNNKASNATTSLNDFSVHGYRPAVQYAERAAVFNDINSNVTFASGNLSVYFEGTNIMVYVRGLEDEEGAWWTSHTKVKGAGGVLVNAHYDSVSTGYGATDDGVGVVTILQLIKYFTTPGNQPKKGMVALLNNGEEDFLNGAYAFCAHPLAKSQFLRTFLNLEGAGAGGRATLFRSTDTEVSKFYAGSKHPFGTVVSGDGFKAGFVRSQTDYIVFNGILGLRGLDVAFMEPRGRYHTDQDSMRYTTIDSLWHMLSAALSTMKSLTADTSSTFKNETPRKGEEKVSKHSGSEAVWFDLFGSVFLVFQLHTLFALSVTLLVVGPVVLVLISFLLFRVDKLYLFSSSKHHHHAEGDDSVGLQGWRGFFRFPITFVAASAGTVGLAFLLTKFNPFIVYSSPYAVWSMMLSAWLFVAWFVSRAADSVRPTAFHRAYSLLWMFFGGWVVLVLVTVSEERFHLAAGYFMVFYFAGAFLATTISFLELFGLARKAQYADEVEGNILGQDETPGSPRPESVSSSRNPTRSGDGQTHEAVDDEDGHENEPTENTSLLRGRVASTFANYTSRSHIGKPPEAEEVLDDPKRGRVFGYEQPWSWCLPSWAWLIQFLLLAPFTVILIGQIGLYFMSATYQTLADGNSAFTVYIVFAIVSLLILAPLGPFLHRYTYHIPMFLLCVFAGTLIYNLLAFPFSPNNRLKLYFIQRVNLDSGINQVSLTGVKGSYLGEVISSLPSTAGQPWTCADNNLKLGLTECGWRGIPPRVVPATHPEVPPFYGYVDWLTYNITRNGHEALIHVEGANTRACKIQFNRAVSDVRILGADEASPSRRVPEDGSREVRLWSRNWGKAWDVHVEWEVSGGDDDGGGLDGRIVCLWNDENKRSTIPALEEIRRFAPDWVAITKLSDGPYFYYVPSSFIVASSTFVKLTNVAQSYLDSLYTQLPTQLQSLIPRPSPTPPPAVSSLPPPLLALLSYCPAAITPTVVLATLAPVIILLFTMSTWRSYMGGRFSPFGAARSPPTVSEDDYHYLGPDDIVDPPRSHIPNSTSSYFPSSRHLSAFRADDTAPDILILKVKGTIYPLHFPAYSIGEGHLRVGDLRKSAAKKIDVGIDPRRLKLLYKGKTLKDDAVACREEGLKQNSELLCVITEGPINGRGDEDSSESASEGEMLREANSGVRIDVDGMIGGGPKKARKGHRGGKKKRRDEAGVYGGSGTNTEGRNSPMPNSGMPQPPAHAPPQQQPQQPRPKSPMDKLNELSSTFHTKFVPQCIQFTSNPPSDAKTRDMEYKKLSETILAQIILKLDEVQTEGDDEARARRKALVRETQAMLSSLDAVVKK
ncbi:hypothetical protein MMC13_006997 [Lambiella insularis]|nr:hypothetical protein [Lambiella insularis]